MVLHGLLKVLDYLKNFVMKDQLNQEIYQNFN